jgi:putative SOS response-associated peptidase YedK
MCGRFYLDARADEIESTLDITGLSEFYPRYNIAPSQPILAVVSGKQPYCIQAADSPLLVFAGLYEHWESPQGETIDSCTIIVTDAARPIEAIHDRMQLCLAPTQFDAWLVDPAVQDPDRLLALLKAAKAPVMKFYPVTRRMNSPRYDRSDAIESVA